MATSKAEEPRSDPDECPSTQEYVEPHDDSQKVSDDNAVQPKPIVEALPSIWPPLPAGLDKYLLSFVEANDSNYPRQIYRLSLVTPVLHDYYKQRLHFACYEVIKSMIDEIGEGSPVKVADLLKRFTISGFKDRWNGSDYLFRQFLVNVPIRPQINRFELIGFIVDSAHVHYESGKRSSSKEIGEESHAWKLWGIMPMITGLKSPASRVS
jgi:hypothetical protein